MQGLGFKEGPAGCILGDFKRGIWEGMGENIHPQPSAPCTLCQAFFIHISTESHNVGSYYLCVIDGDPEAKRFRSLGSVT